MKDTLIVIPAFNEEKGIERVLEGLEGFDDRADVLVVNDGSIDSTFEILNRHKELFVSHPINLGYGAALQTAYKYASAKGYKYVVQYDADGQHHPDDLRQLISEIREDVVDVVIGSRVLGDSSYFPGIRKSIALFWFKAMIRIFTGQKITDPTSGLKGLSHRAFTYYGASPIFPNDFPDADTIIHMLFQGFKIQEFPIRSRRREEGTSMHSGMFKQAVYIMKVTLSIMAILINHWVKDRSKSI